MTVPARRDRGQALPEFALVAPVFFLVLFGIIQMGFLLAGQNGMSNAAREAARYASTLPTPSLVVAGDYDGSDHVPWDCSAGDAILRIEADWRAWGHDVPTPGAVVWLDLTADGRRIGEGVLAREQQHTS